MTEKNIGLNPKIRKFVDALIETQIKHPEITPDKVLIINLENECLDKIFTPARKEILEVIKHKNPKNIGDIARLVDRSMESVSRDLRILENYGLVEMEHIGREKIPHLEKDLLLIPL